MSDRAARQDLSDVEFQVGGVRVRPAQLTVEHGGHTERLEPRVMEILVCLAEHDGATVSREFLRETLWDAYVTDDAINRAVWKLRRTLGEHADLVTTVSKRGYRLTGTVTLLSDARSVEAVNAVASSRMRLGLATVVIVAIVAAVASAMSGRSVLPGAPPALDAPEDASAFAPFTTMSGYESSPSISADGATVVFANFAKEGPAAFQWDLWSRPVHGGDAVRITETAAHEFSPALSPAGDRLAFVRMAGDNCRLVTVDTATGQETVLDASCGVSRGPSDCCPSLVWRGDATLLVSRRDAAASPRRIVEVDIDGRAARILTDPPAQWFGDAAPAVSPDGGRIAFVRQRSPEIHDIHVLDLTSGALQRLTREGYQISGVAWEPDGESLIFGWKRTGTVRLWRVFLAGGDPVPVATVGMNASSPARVAGAIVYEEWKSEINLWDVDFSTASPTAAPVVISTRWDWMGRRSPDRSRLAFASNRDGSAEIWLAEAAGADARRLSAFGTEIVSAPAWAPDGGRLAVAAGHAGGVDIALLDAASGAVTWIVTDASDDRDPQFSRDGKSVYFVSNRSGDWNLWVADLARATTRALTTDGGIAVRESSTGALYFMRPYEPGLWRLDADRDVAPVRVEAAFQPNTSADWVVLGETVYYTRVDAEGGAWLSRLDPATGVHGDVVDLVAVGLGEVFAGAGIWLDIAARRLMISSVDRSHSDLWIRRDAS